MRSRLLAIFAALVFAVAFLSSCSKSDESAKDLPDAATLLQQSSDTTKNQTSVHLRLTVQGTIEQLPIESLEGDLTNVPAVAAQGKANINFLGQRLEGIEFVVFDGILYGAINAGGQLQDFGPAAEVYDASAILSPKRAWPTSSPTSPIPRPTAARRSTASRPSGSPGTSAPTRSTRSRRRSARPVRCPEPPGSPRRATTN